MIRINNLKFPIDYNDELLKKRVAKELRIDENSIEKLSLFRRSIDARNKNDINFLISVDVFLNTNENKALSKAKSNKAKITDPYEYKFLQLKSLIQDLS